MRNLFRALLFLHMFSTILSIIFGDMKHIVFALVVSVLCYSTAQAQPVTIAEVIQRALQKSPAILQAQADLHATEQKLSSIRTSMWMPQLAVSAIPVAISSNSAQMQGGATLSLELSLPTGAALRVSYMGSLRYSSGDFHGSLSGELTQPLWFDVSLTEATLELYRQETAWTEAQQTIAETQRQLTLDLLNNILDLSATSQSIEIAQARAELSRKNLEEIHSQVQRGQAGQTDLLAAQIDLRQRELTLAKLQRDFALTQEKFFTTYGLEKTLTWQAPTVREELKDLAEVLLHIEITPAVLAKDSRVRRAAQQVTEAERLLKKAQQDALPQIGLTLSYDDQSAGWGVGLSFRHSFFTGQALKVQEAQRTLAQAQRSLQAMRETVRLEFLAQRNALQEAYSHLEVLALKSELLALQHQIKQQQLEKGLISTSDWEEFLIQTREFENERRATLYQLTIAYLKYKNSLGLSFSPKEVFLDEQNP